MESAGVLKPPKYKDAVTFDGADMGGKQAATGIGPRSHGILDDMEFHLENAEKDWDNINEFGDAYAAFNETGKRMGPDMGTFYDRMRTDTDVQQAIDLAVQHKAEALTAKGFRGVLTDQKLQRQVRAFATLANVDPAGLLGILQQAANASKTLTAKMIVIGSLTTKAFTDASLMAARYKIGDWSEFGGKEAMEQAIAKRFSLATTMLHMTDEIRAQGGRTLRANRGKPFDPSLFEGLSKERFYELLAKSGGSPEKLKYLADPTLYQKIMDTANFIRINSLISGWTTQAVNLLTTGYMVGIRPLERMAPAAAHWALTGSEEANHIMRENALQYRYFGAAMLDGWRSAVEAFTRNDSVLKPHSSEMLNAGEAGAWNVPGSQPLGKGFFKPWDSLPHLIYNVMSIPMTAVGSPSRTLGAADEMMKQITYRSKLMARVHMEATEKAAEMGLSGKGAKNYIKSFVDDAMNNAFDAQGRGIDPDALREANIATFQQDLLPGTIGRNVQTFVSNDKTRLVRFILPFVKTPTNVLRYGWKMTPGLNLLQQEYRQMLFNKVGTEAMHQAIGQMSMGALFMGTAAFVLQDRITGGGPSDPARKAELLATGWRPYSLVTKNDDGTTTYAPFNRMDPIALPLGIISDIMDAHAIYDEIGQEPPAEIASAIGALGISLAKQFTSRTYLLSMNQALEAISDPGRRGEGFMGNMAASFIPFSSMTRQTNSDPYMRDARTIADKMMQAIPGQSASLPARYNWLGQPVVNRQGLWTDDNGTLVDKEVQRLSLLPEAQMVSVPSPTWGKVDLRDITLKDGSNAYTKYQQLAGKLSAKSPSLRDQIAKVMRTEGYQKAADGDMGIPGTKLFLLHKIVYANRTAASKIIKADPAVRDAMQKSLREVIDHWKDLKRQPTQEERDSLTGIMRGFGAAQ